MSIVFIMPVMRPDAGLIVLDHLNRQTVLIDKIIVVDNGRNFKVDEDAYQFKVEVIRPTRNMGTNWAWNKAFDIDSDIVGLVGDDYELHTDVIAVLKRGIEIFPTAVCVSSTIYRTKPMRTTSLKEINYRKVPGKGHIGIVLFKKCFLDCIPKIPVKLRVFYGDNWFGFWADQLGVDILELSCSIYHAHRNDLSEKLDYESLIKKERAVWNKWGSGKLKL